MPKITKYNVRLEQFAVWKAGFTAEEVEKIILLEELQTFEKGKVGDKPNEEGIVTDVRDSDISWLYPSASSQWVYDRFSHITSRVNYDHFMLNIDGYDSFQYTKYKPGQHYDWHLDIAFSYENFIRKISGVVILSDPDDYRGGELEIIPHGNPDKSIKLKPEKGDIVYFASWMPHRVIPVVSGERRTLVNWVMGEREC
jgi:PKHD-type hydroxylase